LKNFLALAGFLFLAGCGRQGGDTTLARVGGQTLTMDQARREIDTTQTPFDTQLPSYVANWATDEVLYEEATKAGVEDNDTLKLRIEDARRRLMIEALLQQRVYSDTGAIIDADIHAYFQQHAAEFVAREDMLQLNIMGLTDRDAANTFANDVAQGSAWSAEEGKFRADSSRAPMIVGSAARTYFSQSTIFPQELWKVAQNLNVDEVSYPLKTGAGYYVIQLLALVKQGTASNEDIARDEIRGRLMIERRRQKYIDLIGTLRKQYNVEILMNAAKAPDSTRFLNHE
jgi:hypothetical protein